MEQWQGCLAPTCQLALKHAHQTVVQRGGEAVTPEDLLLALLEVDTALVPFLGRWGVDIDELIRTVQCEQPLAPPAASEAGLSALLVEWLASARERHEQPWLHTHHLLSTLAGGSERFQDKAYVAVLEQVPGPAWEALSLSPALPGHAEGHQDLVPLIHAMDKSAIAAFPLSSSVHALATDIVGHLIRTHAGLLWLQTRSNVRLEALLGQLQRMVQAVAARSNPVVASRRWYRVEWERAGEDDRAMEALFQALTESVSGKGTAVFVFEGCSPTILTLLVQRIGVLRWRHLLATARPVLLLTSPPLRQTPGPGGWLQDNLGLPLHSFVVPLLSQEECIRYLRFCQSGMERRWRLEIADAALCTAVYLARAAAHGESCDGEGEDSVGEGADPERALTLLRDAAGTKLTTLANGSATLVELRARWEDLQRRCLLAGARAEGGGELRESLDEVALELAAEEAHWNECVSLNASVLMRDDVIAQALRRAGVPILRAEERLRERLGEAGRASLYAVDR